MADIPQVLASYDALVGVALGAGLTYGFGALNRRHQEKREDETRWYEKRFAAYVQITLAVNNTAMLITRAERSLEDREGAAAAVGDALGTIRLVGSEEVIEVAERLAKATHGAMRTAEAGKPIYMPPWSALLLEFESAARKDLGHPVIATENAK
jgi:hypothetical protein